MEGGKNERLVAGTTTDAERLGVDRFQIFFVADMRDGHGLTAIRAMEQERVHVLSDHGDNRRANEREVYAESTRSGRTGTKGKQKRKNRKKVKGEGLKRQRQNAELRVSHHTSKKHHLRTACGTLGLVGLGWELDVLGAGMKGKLLAMPGDGAGEATGQIDVGGEGFTFDGIFHLEHTLRNRDAGVGVTQLAEMRLKTQGLETRSGGAHAGNDGQQVEIGMGAPGVGIGTSGLGRFGPGGQAESNHVVPGSEQLQVRVAHTGVVESAGEIKAEIVGGSGHGRNRAVGLVGFFAGGQDIG